MEAIGVHPPEVVLLAVHEGDGDLFGVGRHQLWVAGDVDLVETLTQLGADLRDDRAGVIAEVTSGLSQQADTRFSHAELTLTTRVFHMGGVRGQTLRIASLAR